MYSIKCVLEAAMKIISAEEFMLLSYTEHKDY